MRSILETCVARPDIVSGSFNPEIFTASLSQVMDFYRGRAGIIHPLYTDAEQFFREGTHPTEGLKMVLSDVFSRLAGDNTVPAIHRLETAFGGGKTHILIALAHLGFLGREVAFAAEKIIDSRLLLPKGETSVIGIAGDEIPVHKPQGKELVPYTLWGEMAFQVGGEALYNKLEGEAASYAAPGEGFLREILGGRKALILLDELAQYAARLEAAGKPKDCGTRQPLAGIQLAQTGRDFRRRCIRRRTLVRFLVHLEETELAVGDANAQFVQDCPDGNPGNGHIVGNFPADGTGQAMFF